MGYNGTISGQSGDVHGILRSTMMINGCQWFIVAIDGYTGTVGYDPPQDGI